MLGTYAVLITVGKLRSGSAKAAAISKLPAPAAPDYHTRACKAPPPPLPLSPPASFSPRPAPFVCARRSRRRPASAPSPFPAAIVVSSDIPGFGSPEWEDFINKDSNNFQVWLEAQFKE